MDLIVFLSTLLLLCCKMNSLITYQCEWPLKCNNDEIIDQFSSDSYNIGPQKSNFHPFDSIKGSTKIYLFPQCISLHINKPYEINPHFTKGFVRKVVTKLSTLVATRFPISTIIPSLAIFISILLWSWPPISIQKNW